MNNEKDIKQLEVQNAFNGALLVAICINIYITKLYKETLLDKSKTNKNNKIIYKLAILSANIFLIVTIYFLIVSYNTYEKEKTEANYNFYMASVLSFLAQSIRINTIYKFPESISGSQDVI